MPCILGFVMCTAFKNLSDINTSVQLVLLFFKICQFYFLFKINLKNPSCQLVSIGMKANFIAN